MKFEYPIPVSGEDATELLGHKNSVGHYPMGRLFNWHGGLHVFERQYAPIKAIADGVVIAYRVGKTAIECEGVKFSNSFVLVKHKYVSPQGRELPFYSLYNHLMTFDELEAQQKVPDIFAVQKHEVSGQTIKGLFMRKASNYDEKVLVPEGMTVTIDFETTSQSAGATQWAANKKKEQYKKVKYVDPYTKTEYEDYFIFYSSDRFTHVVSDNYQVATIEDSTLKKGENIRELNGSSIKYVVPNGTAVVVDGFVGDKKDYYRVKSLDGEKCDEELRVWAKSLKEAKEKAMCLEEGDCGDVVTGEDCDIAVSAGDIVGFVGLNGFANNENHRSVHVEVFTNEASLSSFLKGVEGDKDDVKDTLNYTKIARGAKLSLKYPLTILKDDEVKVEEFPEGEDEKYCRISLAKVVREAAYYRNSSPSAADTYLSYKAGTEVKEEGKRVSAQYTPAKLKELNLLFYNTLQKDSILDWVASPADDRRKVSFCPPASSLTLWTTKAALGISSKPAGAIKLTSDLPELYYKRPENDEIEFEVEQDVFQKTSELEKIGSDDEQNCWYKVKAVRSKLDADQKRTFSSVEGYIKSDDSGVSKVSAYDWEAFGFEMLDSQADVFVFNNSTEGIKESSAAEFLKAVWKHIDLNGDGELSRPELANALKDSLSQQRLSRLICHHQSEWGVDYEALKSEVEVLLDEGINKEEDEEKKQKLTEKKNKTLASLETKVKSFNFWAEVKEPVISLKEKPQISSTINLPPIEFKLSGGDLALKKPFNSIFPLLKENNIRSLDLPEIPEIEVEYVSLPDQPKFWHFHPIAFVEQMRRFAVEPEGYIDWDFIGKREGSEVLVGYVPCETVTEIIEVKDKQGEPVLKDGKVQKREVSKQVAIGRSGVTIATGFDIGQNSSQDLMRIFKSDLVLYNLYLPYANKRKQDAIDYLNDNPLEITLEQAKRTDVLVKESQVNTIVKRYDSFEMPLPFLNLSAGVQTVVVSICFQWGAYSSNLNPMWDALKENDIAKLEAYWDSQIQNTIYKVRRRQELQFLRENINVFL